MIPLTDTAPVRNFPWMNWLIIVLNVAAFYFETALSDDQLCTFLAITLKTAWGLGSILGLLAMYKQPTKLSTPSVDYLPDNNKGFLLK